ncbi:MAG: hypothetical protein Tsb0010_10390 [Parvularculaceae bacterium]
MVGKRGRFSDRLTDRAPDMALWVTIYLIATVLILRLLQIFTVSAIACESEFKEAWLEPDAAFVGPLLLVGGLSILFAVWAVYIVRVQRAWLRGALQLAVALMLSAWSLMMFGWLEPGEFALADMAAEFALRDASQYVFFREEFIPSGGDRLKPGQYGEIVDLSHIDQFYLVDPADRFGPAVWFHEALERLRSQ